MLFVQLQHLLYILPRIAEPWHLMLPAEFTLAVQPVVEEVGTGDDDFQRLQRQIILPFSFVVGVHLFQGVVQYFGELLQAVRHLCKLYQPLVAAFGMLVHKHGSSRVIHYLCTGLGTCPGKSSFRIIHNQLLAERVDKVLGASGDDELIGMLRRELHRIPNHISPQTGRSGDYHGVVLVQFHLFEAESVRILLAYIFQWDEFVEDAVVNHQ